ncbi:hypothetical protein EDC39_1169 [Geothermobacter ehrlichii]|uniref:Uncharacterized protein n=1 Tax=Geothermobacter ehrlichii TaxID=213224 RepID=A0A5D3WGH3_9BACT|nr:hypothetical protein EDC39_1169 [Geothermobacter ehrlichii]
MEIHIYLGDEKRVQNEKLQAIMVTKYCFTGG